MTEWFECKVKYDKTMENGLVKTVTEPYLVDAVNFTEAERRFIDEIQPFMTGEFTVTDIRRARLSEVVESIDLTDDHWYKARIAYITLDEKKGVENRVLQSILVQAKDFHTALKNLDASMVGTLGDWSVVSMAETRIMDIFKYVADGSDSPEDK